MTISLAQAFAQWRELTADLPADDVPMLSEAWNDYTDSLTKDGELTALQYHYAPAYDDAMPGEGSRFDPLAADRDFILNAMGVTMKCTRKDTRPDADQWDKSASHWRVTLRRNGQSMMLDYSMGAAHTGEPELSYVLNAVMRDSEYAGESFADFCDSLGYDQDSRKAYRTWQACKRSAESLIRLFTSSDLSDLSELFADF